MKTIMNLPTVTNDQLVLQLRVGGYATISAMRLITSKPKSENRKSLDKKQQ